MNYSLNYFLLICLILVSVNVHAASPVRVTDLKCEYLVNPIGIDVRNPRLSWQLKDSRTGARQTFYTIIVNTDSVALGNSKSDQVWSSGKIRSANQLVTYRGKQLRPFTRYFWAVKTWDQDRKKTSLSPISSFETGMMEQKNWKGAWISDSEDTQLKPAPYFRKTFRATRKIVSARAYIAVAGLYELYINGNKIGNHRLNPVYTRFDRRTIYVAHDVTSALNSGSNAIGVLLGNGWYNHQSTAVWDFHKAPWRNRPAFCMDLRITYDDGTVETITSGKDWKTSLSPVILNSIYTGEHYDARLEQAGWNQASFDDSKWKNVIYRTAPSRNIVSQVMHPIRDVEELTVKNFKQLNDSTYLYDFGRNISGVSRISVKGSPGTVLMLKHAERVYSNGHVDQSNIDEHYRPTDDRDPFQTDVFILSGKGTETFSPRFNYKGFQFVEVSVKGSAVLNRQSLTAQFLHSDVPPVGQISSSNTTLNKIWQATNNSYLSNLFGYPTDCPQREKNGWTGDAHIAVETGLYSFDGITVYEKWMADHRDEQQPNGVLPSIIPTGGWGYEWGNGPDWTSSIAIIPWNLYLFYGDTKVLEDCYDPIKRYVDHITEGSPSGLTSWGLGDWVPVKSKSPVEFTSSVYYYTDLLILSKTAELLNRSEDHVRYTSLAEKVRKAINDKYLNKETGIYGSGLQTELSAALYWGIAEDDMKPLVAANLAKRVKEDNYHLDVGLLGTKSILNALSENGYADVAYKIVAQETYPSWGWWIVNGASTLYENWDINAKRDISMNHIMFGEVGAWMYKGLGGIRPDESKPGFRNVLLQPNFVPGLDHFRASHQSPYGLIESGWQKESDRLVYEAVIPANSTATLRLSVGADEELYISGRPVKQAGLQEIGNPPTLRTFQLRAGKHRFEIIKTGLAKLSR
ncbi:family 78 glycoside hydrolase catalytic domain [Flavihumibacter sp. R14]|nr:family 78 glycoside hydrolase catalytic domain [Flavihumibacter soli]